MKKVETPFTFILCAPPTKLPYTLWIIKYKLKDRKNSIVQFHLIASWCNRCKVIRNFKEKNMLQTST